MNGKFRQSSDVPQEKDAAALTDVAYRVMLGHGLGDKWLEIQLELWRTLKEHVQKAERKINEPMVRSNPLPEFDWWSTAAK